MLVLVMRKIIYNLLELIKSILLNTTTNSNKKWKRYPSKNSILCNNEG